MNGYILDYRNKLEYRNLERALKRYNMLAYKKLNFDYYPMLRSGKFKGDIIKKNEKAHTKTYKLKLPSDLLFTQVHGDVTLEYTVYEKQNTIVLDTITPTKMLLEGHSNELRTYKGVMISKQNAEKDKFMIDLFSALDK